MGISTDDSWSVSEWTELSKFKVTYDPVSVQDSFVEKVGEVLVALDRVLKEELLLLYLVAYWQSVANIVVAS